jgi:Pregnancy-associated plasma protein-A
MKKLLILTFTLISSIYSFSQSFTCGVTGALTHDNLFERSPQTVPYDATTPYIVNAHFTLINRSDNNFPPNPNGVNFYTGLNFVDTPEQIENQFLNCISLLNHVYNPLNIFFKYTGYQVVINDLVNGGNVIWQDFAPYKQEDAINFYFINKAGNVVATSQSSIMGGTENINSIQFLLNTNSTTYVPGPMLQQLIHNVGHNLGLYHVSETGSHYPDCTNCLCERVTRDPLQILLYNAHKAGDEVIDTPAQPSLMSAVNFLPNCGDYIYDANNQNCYGEPYENIISGNYMKEVPSGDSNNCNHFTAGQTERMRKFIQYNNSDYNIENYPTVRNEISSLYEPFKTNVFAGNVVSTEDQPDSGGAKVCREQKYKLRFQPGYDQEFSNTTSGVIPQIWSQQFNYDNVFDHVIGVKIPLINNNIINVGIISSILPYLCIFEPYTSGTIIYTAILGSMNITIEELDTIKVKNPHLYDELMEQYYYILKKETASGAKTEKIFYKQ